MAPRRRSKPGKPSVFRGTAIVAWTMLIRGGVNPVEDRAEARGLARSRERAACRRKELLYSEKRSRDALFQIIETILTEQEQTGEHRIVSPRPPARPAPAP